MLTASGSHYNEVRLEQEISNPHYIKTFYADNNVEINKEASLTLNNTQCKTGQNEGQPQSADCSAVTADEANNEGMHTPANYNKEKAIDYCNHSPEYAAVNKAKYGLKIKNSVQVTADDEWFSPSYDEVGGHEAASKTVVIIKEQENPSACIEPQKRSPSPVYAEVHKDKKKKKQQEDHSVVVEEGERSQSPEYSKVENIKKHSKNIIENQEDEQHYYHSLEKPEEHGCTGNNIGETVYISEDSQKSQIVSTQSMLCETPDPDANTHTQTTDSEVKIFPNPCYHTKMLAAD